MKRSPAVPPLILLLVFSLAITSLAGCGGVTSYQKYADQILGPFDTVTQIVAYCQTPQDFERLQTKLTARLEALSDLYTIYQNDDHRNNIKTINDQAGIAPVLVQQEIVGLLQFAQDAYPKSHRTVNVALGPVLAVWHDYRERGLENPALATLPDLAKLEQANELVALDKLVIDPTANTVFLPEVGMSLDVGAIAKGYAAQRIADELQADGFHSFLLTMGGNVVAVGKPLDGPRDQWKIGVQNPDLAANGELLDTLLVSDLACVTSGDYQRFYTVNGKRFHHIIDPQTLFPANRYKSVTILHPDAGMADLLSTAIFLLPKEEGEQLAAEQQAGVLWVLPDDSVLTNAQYRIFSAQYGTSPRA